MSTATLSTATLTNTAARYGSVTKVFHWLTALLILSLIPLGLIANDLPYDTSEQLARKAQLFSLHKTLGVLVFFVALARIAWAIGQPKPASLHPARRTEGFMAELVHWLLYASLVLVPLTGWIHHAATTGFAPIWWPFGQALPFVPKDDGVAHLFASLHVLFQRVLLLSLGLHVVGALKHHFWDKDATLRRMWFGYTHAAAPAAPRKNRLAPLGSAFGIYLLALGIAVFNVESRAAQPVTPALAAVASDWTVQEGSLAIAITQFDNEVTGQFADWTAAISFDENAPAEDMGTVDVAISVPSLTLGSVTSQAMGSDFFDAEGHPTARFIGTITGTETGYLADGVLTLKGAELPVQLPFSLSIDGDTAQMAGEVTLDRLDYGIGASMPDESNLGFDVTVSVALTATR